MERGTEVIDLSIGDPREVTPAFIADALKAHVPTRSSYPTVLGRRSLREAIARWCERRFAVTLDPETQILPANGSKEAVFSIHLALVDPSAPRRRIVIPSPAYPVYERGAAFAGGVPTLLPLARANGFLPDLDAVHIRDRVERPWRAVERDAQITRARFLLRERRRRSGRPGEAHQRGGTEEDQAPGR